MPRGFGRLPFLTRRDARSDGPSGAAPALVVAAPQDDRALVGPPALLPAAIIRQVLFDATEFTPLWAMPRQTIDPEPLRPSRPAAEASAAAPTPATSEPTKARRTRRPKADAPAATGSPDPATGSAKPTPRRTRRTQRKPPSS